MTTSPIYDRIRDAIQTSGLTQKQIAKGSGVPFSTVSKLAQGATTNPTINTLQALADFFEKLESAEPCSPACPLAYIQRHDRPAV